MFYRYSVISILIALYCSQLIASISVVYNMRISVITRQLLTYNQSDHHPHILIETPFGQFRRYNEGTRESDGGTISTYIYYQPSHYFSADVAFARITHQNENISIARTQMDDILLTGGYGHAIKERGRIAYSFLLGIPTHRDYFLEVVQFGSGHFGVGPQLDTAYRISSENTLFGAARCIYFIPRKAEQKDPCLPSYDYNNYKVRLGCLADLLVSYMKTWHTTNRCEIGYDATLGFAESISPCIPQLSDFKTFIRHSFFGAYIKNFYINKISNSIILGLSSGFDSRPKNFRALYHMTGWLSWSVTF